jgi:hypothetical protein
MFHWPYEIWLDGVNCIDISQNTTVFYGRISWRRVISREFIELPTSMRSIWQILDHKPNFSSKQCPSVLSCSAWGHRSSVLLSSFWIIFIYFVCHSSFVTLFVPVCSIIRTKYNYFQSITPIFIVKIPSRRRHVSALYSHHQALS